MSGVVQSRTEDKLLLHQLRQGSTHAYRALYEKYWEQTYNQAYKRLRDHDEAEDITQDVFLQLWLKREGTVIENLAAYLFVATRNSVYSYLSKADRFAPVNELLYQLEAHGDQADARLLKTEFLVAYEALIGTLPAAQQTIFRMRYQQDLSPGEIAGILDVSPKTVRNQLGKALSKVKSSLGLLSILFLLLPI